MNFLAKIDTLLSKLRRVSSLEYMPEIDGLRFLAIFLVVLGHGALTLIFRDFSSEGYASVDVHHNFPVVFQEHRWIWSLLTLGAPKGVHIFFVVSGFVLSLPFAKYFIEHEKKITFKEYYLRRLTRIEPPYIIAIISLYIINLFFFDYYNIYDSWKGFLSSLFYSHNLFSHESFIGWGVFWSLEVEVHFYLIAPLIAYIFKFNKITRRSILIATILVIGFVAHVIPPGNFFIYGFLPLFLLGFLLADLYLDKTQLNFHPLVSLTSITFLILFIILNNLQTFGLKLIYIASIFIFFLFVLFEKNSRRLFSFKFFSTIGGMCYSIYLWHSLVIIIVSKHLPVLLNDMYLPVFLFGEILVLFPLILIVTTGLFLLTEKPFMNKNWPKKFRDWVLFKVR